MEIAELRRLDQTDSALNTVSSDKSPIPVAESSGQALATASASSMPGLSDGTLAIVDISNFKTTKIVDKRLGPSGVKYKCEFEPFWLAADLVGTGADGTHSYLGLRERTHTSATPRDSQ